MTDSSPSAVDISAYLVHEDPIQVSIITGFLGSGKTTLLAGILQSNMFSDTAVIVNELGKMGLDHLLLETADEQLALFETGTPLSSDKQREFIRLYHLSSSPLCKLKHSELANNIQSYINTNLQTEKETLFDKLREEPGSNDAAKDNHTQDITTRLTEHPLLVFATGKYGYTPLHKAAGSGHTEVAQALLEAGANMEALSLIHI